MVLHDKREAPSVREETMRRERSAAVLVAVLMAVAGCSVSDADIERWKHTQRGPRKITTVLISTEYPQPMRVHAARALVEMRHPNANGLELLASALTQTPQADRETLVHALMPELRQMMNGAAQAGSSGPTMEQIRAKDAAFVLLRGDGRASFASNEDRQVLVNELLDWMLADFNSRALAGQATAEQIVGVAREAAIARLTAAINAQDGTIPVLGEFSRLINGVASPQGKQAATARLVAVAREIEAPAITPRLVAKARELTTGRQVPEATLNRLAETLREQYLTRVFDSIRTLGQPNGGEYLVSVAANAASPLDRRKAALASAQNIAPASQAQNLLGVVNCAIGPTCDMALRGLAVDRLGESGDRNLIPQLFALYDAQNGGVADDGFVVRWKLGEAIIRLGGAGVIPEFMNHLAVQRPAPFAGYTFREVNGEAQAIGDITPPPRDAMRGYLAPNFAPQVRALAVIFLGLKGEERDLAALDGLRSDTTALTGEGWSAENVGTLGAVATRARESLNNSLHGGQAGAADAGAPGAR